MARASKSGQMEVATKANGFKTSSEAKELSPRKIKMSLSECLSMEKPMVTVSTTITKASQKALSIKVTFSRAKCMGTLN